MEQIGELSSTVVTGTTGTLDPLGTNTANAISPTTASGGHFVGSNVPTQVSFTSGTIYTQTAFLKQGTGAAGRYVQLSFATSRFSQEGYANFDLQTGALVASGGISADSNRAASIENYGNGWYRCRFTATCNGTGNQRGLFVYLITASGDTRAPLFTGVTGDVLYGWGAQLETGSTATPYIPTTTGSVFRNGTVFPQLPTVGGADFTFTRATTATRVNASGLIESVASGVLRLDYPVTGGCPAGLIEPSGTNLALRSEEFNTATWFGLGLNAFGSGSVANSTGTTDPFGGTNADYIQENSASGTHLILQINAGQVSGTNLTFSVFAKAAERTRINLLNNGGGGGDATFNLSAGTATLVAGVSASIQNYGNGWYRCILTYTPNATGNFNVQVRLVDASGNTSYTGTGASGLYVFGAQLETGAFPTSYIPTTTASATRAADVCSVSGVSGYIGQTEGVLYAEVDLRIFPANSARILSINDGTSNNAVNIQLLTTGIRVTINASSSGQVDFNSAFSAGIYKIGLAYKQNDVICYVNGTSIGSDTNCLIPACSRLDIGNLVGGNILSDRIRAAAIYTTRLDNNTLANITRLT